MIEAIKFGVIFAVLIEGIHFFSTLYLTKNIQFKNKVLDRFKPLLFFFIILSILYLIFSGFYIVNTNDQAVLTKIDGTKLIIKDTGMHYSFMGKTDEYYMGKQFLDYPSFGQTGEESSLFGEETLITSDGKVVQYSATLFYQIEDLEKFALLSKNTEAKLYYNLGSSITKEISTNNYNELMQDRDKIEIEIKNSFKDFEEIYGIKVLDFKFLRIIDSVVTVSAKAESEAEKIKSEAMINSAKSESEALREKYNSIDDKDFILELEKLNVLKNRDGDTVWLMDGNTPILVK